MIKKIYIWLLLLVPLWTSADSYTLFNDSASLVIVKTGGTYIYNQQPKKADSVISVLSKRIPDHPVIPMMKALNVAWREMPISMESEHFKEHETYLKSCLSKAEAMFKNNPEGHDGIFFQIVSRGLLAEHYSNGGHYLRAVSEAKKVYTLIRLADELVDENPEFLFSVGLYNYYREYYEENNPVMKPLLWFFRRGDKVLGLKQLEEATQKALLSKVEAHIYLSYIYLRYEKVPNKSIRLLEGINRELPGNNFIRAKLAECLVKKGEQAKANSYCNELIQSRDPYYKMSGYALKALNISSEDNINSEFIKDNYEKSVKASNDVDPYKGKYLRSLAHINLAKIYISEERNSEAKHLLEKALEICDDSKQKKESKKLLQNL